MGHLSYPVCIRALYESEIFGEAAFLALVGLTEIPRERYPFATPLQLETENATPSLPDCSRGVTE